MIFQYCANVNKLTDLPELEKNEWNDIPIRTYSNDQTKLIFSFSRSTMLIFQIWSNSE